MTHHKKAITILVVLMSLLLTSTSLVAAQGNGNGRGNGNGHGREVSGVFTLQGYVCDLGIGFCGSGTSAGDIPGDVFIVLTSLSIDPVTGAQSYSATIDITSNRGDLSGTMDAVISFTPEGGLNTVSTMHFTEGTRAYGQRTLTLTTVGTIDPATDLEVDSYSGQFSNRNRP